MAAVVRVKRLLDEEPLDAVVLNCKRRKTEKSGSSSESLAAVLKFAGTVNDQNSDIFKYIKKPTKAEAEEHFKKYNVDITDKLRQEVQAASKENRYKVVNCFRTNGTAPVDPHIEETVLSDSYTVFDIEIQDKKNETTEATAEKDQYVYDLYYTQSDDLGDAELNELISIYPLSEELVYSSYRKNDLNDTDSYDSEDSNAENYYKNDYPDEESDGGESVTDADMVRATRRLNINEESDLSSDEYDEKCLYAEDDDIDEEDEKRYGRSYARFKAKWRGVVDPENGGEHLYFDEADDYYE